LQVDVLIHQFAEIERTQEDLKARIQQTNQAYRTLLEEQYRAIFAEC
jgi:hypothetical protein